MGKKYVIELEDEPFVRKSCLHGEERLYKAVGFNNLVFDEVGLSKLTPLDTEEGSNGIEVGDEVEAVHSGIRGVVLSVGDDEVEGICVDMDGINFFLWYTTEIRKTGRHFSEVDELLKKMK